MGSLGSGRLTWLIQDSAAVSGRLAIPAAGAGAEDEAEAEDAVGTRGVSSILTECPVIVDEVGARGALLGDGVRSRLEADEAEAEAEAASRAAAFSRSSSSEKFQWVCPAETANGARAADHAVAAASLAASSASCMSSAICSDSQASDQPNPKVVSDYCVSHAELSRSSDTFAVCSPHTRSLLKENATET